MRKASVWFLTLAGVVAVVTALSFEGHGGGVSRLRPEGPTLVQSIVCRMGLPEHMAGVGESAQRRSG
jgi:hypothetical protein